MLFAVTLSYGLSCSRPIRLNSLGSMPSRLRKPFRCQDAAFRDLPVSHRSTFLWQRPRVRAALRPAGPAPTITTSNITDFYFGYLMAQASRELRKLESRRA